MCKNSVIRVRILDFTYPFHYVFTVRNVNDVLGQIIIPGYLDIDIIQLSSFWIHTFKNPCNIYRKDFYPIKNVIDSPHGTYRVSHSEECKVNQL